MPGNKYRTIRRRKRQPPYKARKKTNESTSAPSASSASATVPASTSSEPSSLPSTAASSASPSTVSPSQKKLSKSKHISVNVGDDDDSYESDFETFDVYEGEGIRMLEVAGLQTALQSVCCSECGSGPIEFREDFSKKQGLYTAPSFLCVNCSLSTPIPFSTVGTSKALQINRKSVFANKCAGGNLAGLQILFAMMDLPAPVTKNIYSQHVRAICEKSACQAQTSMEQAREEVRQHYAASSDDEVVDVLVSCDGTWQRRGFSSLYGAVFVIAHETGKVVDYIVKSKHCAGCKYWEKQDKTTDAYKKWKDAHECEMNFIGSAGAMEPQGTLDMFQSSLEYKLRYTKLISDGDSKTHSLLLKEQPYGSDHPVEKVDCVGHVQKRMGTALRNLKQQYKGQKLADGKTIGGARRLTDSLINSLQNYYGDAIRRNKGDLESMVKSIQATLLHCNSTDEHPRHHLCPEGEGSWCKWQVAKATGKSFTHKDPIPEAIVALIRPIYARLGSRSLLEKCVHGYTQNANECLHSTLWRFCPKELFFGKVSIDLACALAVCSFNDGASSLTAIASRLGVQSTPLSQHHLRKKDYKRLSRSKYGKSEEAKKHRRAARKKRKGLEDKTKQKEGIVYAAGAFGADDNPGPSKRTRTN